MTTFAKSIFFLTSYLPLIPVLVALHWGEWLVVGCLLAAGVIIVGLAYVAFRLALRPAGTAACFRNVRIRDELPAAYLVTYLLPFMGPTTTSVRQLIALLIMFVFIGVVYVRSDLIYVNPSLSICGWSTYSALDGDGNVAMLVARSQLALSSCERGSLRLRTVSFGGSSWIVKSQESGCIPSESGPCSLSETP